MVGTGVAPLDGGVWCLAPGGLDGRGRVSGTPQTVTDILSGTFGDLDTCPSTSGIESKEAPCRLFLARGGLRSLRGSDSPFLGYTAGELFWKDVLELVHREDLPKVRALISLLVEHPGSSGTLEVRLLDAWGDWRLVEVNVRNVLEGPDDVGLVLADLRAGSIL